MKQIYIQNILETQKNKIFNNGVEFVDIFWNYFL